MTEIHTNTATAIEVVDSCMTIPRFGPERGIYRVFNGALMLLILLGLYLVGGIVAAVVMLALIAAVLAFGHYTCPRYSEIDFRRGLLVQHFNPLLRRQVSKRYSLDEFVSMHSYVDLGKYPRNWVVLRFSSGRKLVLFSAPVQYDGNGFLAKVVEDAWARQIRENIRLYSAIHDEGFNGSTRARERDLLKPGTELNATLISESLGQLHALISAEMKGITLTIRQTDSSKPELSIEAEFQTISEVSSYLEKNTVFRYGDFK
jgi:hypothetical protein